jgi:peptidoglycan lytic transglycosylase
MSQEVLAVRSRFRPRALRAAQFTIAFTMLAVPAEAFALSGSAGSSHTGSASPLPLPVRVSPRHLRLGAPVHVTGRLPSADAGTTVELQSSRSAGGPWSRLAGARVESSGRYTLQARPRHSAVLRAISLSGAMPSGGPVAVAATAHTGRPAVSRVTAVQVKAAMRVSRRARGVIAGHDVLVAGRLLPGRRGRTVAVQRRRGHGWQTVAHSHTGSRGGFAVHFRPAPAAHGALRVVFAGDHANGRATAGAGMLAVYEPVTASWYEDGGATACGFHATYGIANRTLPCGTRVRLSRGGHTVTATVDDRGPYVYGRDYDLDQTTAGALGFAGVGTVDASVR